MCIQCVCIVQTDFDTVFTEITLYILSFALGPLFQSLVFPVLGLALPLSCIPAMCVYERERGDLMLISITTVTPALNWQKT